MLDPESDLRDEAERKQVEARNRLDRETGLPQLVGIWSVDRQGDLAS